MRTGRVRFGDDSKSTVRIPSEAGWFTLWLEFESVIPDTPVDPYSDFFNCIVHTEDGRKCGLNVWTYGVLGELVEEDRASGSCLSGKYLLPPDLLVEKADRELMEEVIKELLEQGYLEDVLDREQLGFNVSFQMGPGLSSDERNDLYLRFREEAIAQQGLEFSGVLLPDSRWNGFASPERLSKDATEAQRVAVGGWLCSAEEVVDYEVGPLCHEWELDSEGGT